MENQVAVVIPVYKKKMNAEEIDSIRRTCFLLEKLDIYFVAPKSLDMSSYMMDEGIYIKRFPDRYFKSAESYTRLLLAKKFYKEFLAYKYILIVQTDVWLLRDWQYLDEIVKKDFDYIGAPWFEGIVAYQYTFFGISHLPRFISKPQKCYVGNGGLSLRKVEAQIKLLSKYYIRSRLWRRVGEDVFFSYYGSKEQSHYKIASIGEAKKFALETSAENYVKAGQVPFGVHAWQKYFTDIKEYDIKAFGS